MATSRTEPRQQSLGRRIKSTIGERAKDKQQSQEQATKLTTGGINILKLPKSRTGVEPRTGVHYFRIEKAKVRHRADNRRVRPALAQFTHSQKTVFKK